MSEVKSTLNKVRDNILNGLGKLNDEAKAKAEGKRSDPQHDELDLDKEFDEVTPRGSDEGLSARSRDEDDIDDGQIIDVEAEPQKPKPKGLDTKQKVLVVVAVIAVGLWYTKQQNTVPTTAPDAPAEQQLQGFISGDSANTAVPGPSFNLGDSTLESNEPIPVAPAESGNDTLGFGSDGVKDAANDPIDSDVITADLTEQFSAPTEESNEVLDPFTGKVKTVAAHPADLPVPEKQEAVLPGMLPEAEHAAKPVAGDLARIGAPGDSPFDVGSSNSTGLSGNKNQNPDSKKGVLQDQSANADVTDLKAKAAEKDSRIGSLETEVSKLKKDLAIAKQDLVAAKQGSTKTSSSKATQHKPVQASHTNQRSTPSQRVASAPKAVPRPRICVTAIAQAARNCTTCVPHAFITHQGTETMVGQGDFLEKLRVNIVGDRLDLQNANGDVVHKFWSSPNGCAAG